MEYKDFRFEEVSAVTPEGVVKGILSPYNNVDLGNDVVRPGAFTRTMNAQKGRVPALLDHDFRQRVGVHYLEDTSDGLATTLRLNMEKQISRDALSDVKFWHENGLSFGLSIGYETIKYKTSGDVRELLEVQLYEGSLTPFPMNTSARTSSAKSIANLIEEIKSGRAISSANRQRLERMLDDLSALLKAAETAEPELAIAQDDPSVKTLVEQLKQANLLMELSSVNTRN